MVVNSLKLSDFRLVKSADLEFSPGINMIYGDNAQGKTTLIEAICLVARGKSFRSPHDADLISFGCDYSSLQMTYNDGREHRVRIAYSADGRRKITRDDIELRKLSELFGGFRCVLFAPSHLGIVREGPSQRRAFVDMAISQLYPAHIVSLQRYQAALAQRNALLRCGFEQKKVIDATIEQWNVQLAEWGAKIRQGRKRYIDRLGVCAAEFLKDMSFGADTLGVEYNINTASESLLHDLESNIEREIRAGTTLYGPHKEDIEIEINGKSARAYASQGQGRSAAVSLKLAEWYISKETTGQAPVLCLDDVLSELDEGRRAYLTEDIKGGQIFITSCDRISPADDTKLFYVHGGNIKSTDFDRETK